MTLKTLKGRFTAVMAFVLALILVFTSLPVQTEAASKKGKFYNDKIGYVTKKQTKVETEYLIFDIDPNVYVVSNVAELADAVCEAMEAVTGRSFKDAKYADRKITVHVNRNNQADPLIENDGKACGTTDDLWIAPSDLFVVDGYTFAHELGHAFHREQIDGFSGRVLDEGFTTYTELKLENYLAENNPDVAVIVGFPDIVRRNMDMECEMMYEQPVEYWFKHPMEAYDFCGNGPYGVGFRLMAYLDAVYGDYTKWMEPFEKLANKEKKKNGVSDIDALPGEIITDCAIKSLKNAYGKKVLKKFYSWLKKHETEFEEKRTPDDYTIAAQTTVYPSYYWYANTTEMGESRGIIYKDLTVYIAPTEYYLRKYKGEDTSKLILHVDPGTVVERYNYSGKLIDTVEKTEISLKNVGAVRLVGEGETTFRITGYKEYSAD